MMLLDKVKKLAHGCFNAVGYDLVKSGHFNANLEAHLKAVFISKEIDCVLDVGANIGQYGQFLRDIGYSGHIVSFEPVKAVFDLLQNKAEADPKWICYNLALSDECRLNDINVYAGTQFSSFLETSEYAKKMWDDVAIATKETVELLRLDDIFPELKNKLECRNFYLKLDTQGFDLKVFNGARESLKHIHAMQSELSLISVYEGMERSFAGIEQYREAGFSISGMYPINVEKSLAVIEYDCVLVKRGI